MLRSIGISAPIVMLLVLGISCDIYSAQNLWLSYTGGQSKDQRCQCMHVGDKEKEDSSSVVSNLQPGCTKQKGLI